MRTKLIASAFALLLAFGVVACEEPADVDDEFEDDGVEEQDDGLEGGDELEDDGFEDDAEENDDF